MSEHADNGAADFEEVGTPPDPLDELVARVTLDVEAAYEPEAVAVLVDLAATNVGAYFKACAVLKAANSLFSKTAMDKLVHKALSSTIDFGGRENTAVGVLLKLAEPAFLFVAAGTREPFADVAIDGARYTHHLDDVDFSDWLINRYLDATQTAPSIETLNTVTRTLAAKARRSGLKLPVFSRIGPIDGKRYMDRGTDDRSVIEVDAAGYRVISGADCPVRFVRPADGMGELPIQEPGGSIDDLRPFCFNLRDEDHFVLAVGWCLGCFLAAGAYPIELLLGHHDSGKTFIQRRQCDLVDPLTDEMWAPAKNETDVVLAAQRTLIQPYDNVVEITADRAATYCRMATGGKIRTRRLYTNGEEFTMRARRPMLMNSTHDGVMTAEDLVDRTIIINTKTDQLGAARKSDEALAAEFAVAWPKLLGAMLAAVSEGLRRSQDPLPENLPRMADFAIWVSRCETGLGWAPGTFLTAYQQNIRYAALLTGSLDPVAATVISLMDRHKGKIWQNTPAKLLRELRVLAGDGEAASRDWPKSPNWLSYRLAELSPLLRRNDIAVAFQRTKLARTVMLTKLTADASP